MAAAGYELELLQEAGRPALQAIGALMRKVPPPNWVQGRVSGHRLCATRRTHRHMLPAGLSVACVYGVAAT